MNVRRLLVASVLLAASCGKGETGSAGARPAGGAMDAEFATVAGEVLDDYYQRHPSAATYLGIHKYDAILDDYSRSGVNAEVDAIRAFQPRLRNISADALSPSKQLDREQLILALESRLLTLETIRPWATNPDLYSSGLTQTAFTMVRRNFAPPEERLRKLITRERQMPGALAEARKNLVNPPRIYTEIAIEQIDGNRDFFKTAVPEAFASVKDQALLKEFKEANQGVIDALNGYKTFLQRDLLPRSTGDFAIGPDTFRRKLHADEMVDLPLDRLLGIAEADLKKNTQALVETAAKITPGASPVEVLASLQKAHPPADKLLATTQQMLDSLRTFITDHHIVTIPSQTPARVEETPPFMRAMTSASMDTPGPFETKATEAYYNMTLPDPAWNDKEKGDFMRQWYPEAISNVSVHEVYPGHYLQFLYGPQFPSDVRKVFGATTNAEGWAHYAEQMMLDEGLHNGDPRYRLAQLQDALLRDVRFIVGIKMHTEGMTVAQAQEMFEKQGYQPRPVAVSEAKRGTSDPTYGYYTMGKLMILKLRDDYKAAKGSEYSLERFHDEFVKLGPLPLPLIRLAMLGTQGEVF